MNPPTWLLVTLGVAVAFLSAAVTVLALRERRHQLAGRGELCGDLRPQLVPIPDSYAVAVDCVKPYGHVSRWHRGEDGSEWTEHLGVTA